MPFSLLGLSPLLCQAAQAHGYTAPTAVQQAATPAILQGRDVIASAQTGSGKTASFVLPLLQLWFMSATPRSPRRAQVLVLVPTRELAVQVADTFASLGGPLLRRMKVVALFGGVSVNPQMMKLRGGADIVVATPGRLIDLLGQNALELGGVKTLVLDEADRLLDLGFSDELDRILALLPARRQNLLVSATFPPAIDSLARSLLADPVRIEIAAAAQPQPDITERAIEVDARRRTQLLRHLIQLEKWNGVLVFVATKHAAEIVADKLRKAEIAAEPFHGELSQGKRTQVLRDFKAREVQVVVATDVAARGLDISELPVVVNFDLPRSPVDYTHRIGRTGRAGKSGVALAFVSAATLPHFRLIEKRLGRTLPLEHVASFEPLEVMPENPADPLRTGGIKGRRPSKKDRLRALAAAGNDIPSRNT
jgi:ATP-dependent RNA helicase RhlE